MFPLINIPSGAILNVFLPEKKGNLKRKIMNIEAKIIQKRFGFEKLLNHSAVIERQGENVLIWESRVIGGVAPTEISMYSQDAVFIITKADIPGKQVMSRVKAESGKSYDVHSWWVYLKFLISGKWKGDTTFDEYSKKWYCSELIDHAGKLSNNPEKSTPNHVYRYSKHNEIWSGTWVDLTHGIKNGRIEIN